MVAARRRDLQRALGLLLAVDLGKILLHRRRRVPRGGVRGGRNRLDAEQVVDDAEQSRAGDDLEPLDERRLLGVLGGHEDPLVAELAQPARSHQHAVDVAHAAVEGQLADEGAAGRRQAVRARQGDGNRDG